MSHFTFTMKYTNVYLTLLVLLVIAIFYGHFVLFWGICRNCRIGTGGEEVSSTTLEDTEIVKYLQVIHKTSEESFADKVTKESSVVLKARQDRVKKMCKKHHIEIVQRYKQIWPSKTYENVLGHADIFENRYAGFIWCRVPKAASVSWTAIFVKKW